VGGFDKKKHLIWLTTCQFNKLKGDAVQTLYALKALAAQDVGIDVVFAPDSETPPFLCGEIPGVEYHIVKNPQEVAICLWAQDRGACVLTRGLRMTTDMIGTIPKENLLAYLYGNHWKASGETLNKITDSCSAVLTQNIFGNF